MLDALLDWAVVLLPTVLSVVGVLVSLKAPHSKHHLWLRIALIAFGIFVSIITFWQQSRSRHAHATEVAALNGTLNSVSSDLTNVERQVKTLTDSQQVEVARRQQAEKDLMLALEATSKATRQGVTEDIKKTPLKVAVSGAGGHTDEEKKQRAAIRTKLGLMMNEGRALMAFCVNPPAPALGTMFSCLNETRNWESKVANYLQQNIEPSYLSRFESATGTSLSWSGVDTKTNAILQRVHDQTDVLEKFIQELLD